jgi:hypothetical protein
MVPKVSQKLSNQLIVPRYPVHDLAPGNLHVATKKVFAMRMDGSGWKKLSGYEDGLPGGLLSR